MELPKVEQLVLDKDAIAVVIKCPDMISRDGREQLRADLLKAGITLPSLVLCRGIELQVIRAADAVVVEVE